MENIIELLKDYVDNEFDGNISEAARSLNINVQTFTKWVKGERKPSYNKISPFMDRLGVKLPPTGKFTPSTDMITVPVCAYAGAGGECFFDDLSPIGEINILSNFYRQDLKVLQIIGDSMTPTIADGAHIGVVPFDGKLNLGKIYLINVQPFGLMAKRIFQNASGEIVLRSDNQNHEDRTIPFEGYDNIIIGQVIWVWQNL